MSEIYIIGNGVVALSAAVKLAETGARVTLFDKPAEAGNSSANPRLYNRPQPASWGNAGHIAIEQTAPLASSDTILSAGKRLFMMGGALGLPPGSMAHWLPFAMRLIASATPSRFATGQKMLKELLADSMPAWKALATTLGAPDLVQEDGHLTVWESPESAIKGMAAWKSADIGTAALSPLPPAMLARVQALVGKSVTLADGALFGHTGQVTDLSRLQLALRETFTSLGGTFLPGTATLEKAGGKASLRLENGETVTPDTILIAAGVGSRGLMEAIGHRVPIIAERGYHIRARAEGWPADLPPLVFEDRSMIVTRYADCVQAASFVEFGSPDGPADPAKWDRLEKHIAELGLPFGERLQRWIGARPTLPDYLPAIGRSTLAENIVYAFGHQHLGLTLAPVTAHLVCDLVAGGSPAFDIGPMAVERFGFGKEKK